MQTFNWWDQIPNDEATGKPIFATKTQLAADKLKPVGSPVARIEYRAGRYQKCYDLYRVADAVPKRKMSEEARAKAVAVLEAARVKQRTCKTCGGIADSAAYLRYGECETCIEGEREREIAEMCREDRDTTILWARQVLGNDFYVVDTETTGLPESPTAEIVEIAVVDGQSGDILYQSLVKPRFGMGATYIHGITEDMVVNAPDARDVWEQIAPLITEGKPLYAYSASFDEDMVGRMTRAALWNTDTVPVTVPPFIDKYFRTGRYGGYVRGKDSELLTLQDALPTEDQAAEHGLMCQTVEEAADIIAAYDRYQAENQRVCEAARDIEKRMQWRDIMELYSAFRGWWSDYHRSYTWQRLPGSREHRAAGDARAARSVLWTMATAIHLLDGLAGDGI